MVATITMHFFSFTLQNGSHYELSQPVWLWLIPIILGINFILKLNTLKYVVKSTPTGLVEISDKQQFMHPLINTLNLATSHLNVKSTSSLIKAFILVLLTLALAQPIKIGEKLPEPPQERDIIFIVDTSVSMILRDYMLDGERIDRMSLLKGVLDSFIHKLKGERMSIIVFGDHAYTLVPLTSDELLLRKMLSRVQATMAGRFNAIGEAIALAVKQATNNDINSKRKRVLVLLTDADQPTGSIDPIVAAQLAKNAKLPLYTIAIGATTFAAEENRQGGLLYSPVDLYLIQQLSSITGAKNYQAGNPDALKNAIHAINSHETNKQKIKPQYFREPLYYWLLIIALVTFSIQQLIHALLIKKKAYSQ